MRGPAVGEGVLREFGSTVSGSGTLGLLLGHRRVRDLLTLRALLDAVRAAPPGVLPPDAVRRALGHWRLLEAAERADAPATREVVHYPFTTAWAEHCLRALTIPSPPPLPLLRGPGPGTAPRPSAAGPGPGSGSAAGPGSGAPDGSAYGPASVPVPEPGAAAGPVLGAGPVPIAGSASASSDGPASGPGPGPIRPVSRDGSACGPGDAASRPVQGSADGAAVPRTVPFAGPRSGSVVGAADRSPPGPWPRPDVGRLAAVAAAAAAQAGLRFTVDVAVTDGVLALPTVGGLRPPGPPTAEVRVEGLGDRLLLRPGPAAGGAPPPGPGWPVEVRREPDGVWRSAAPGWRPSRAVRTGSGHRVLIDETDPYRGDEPGAAANPYRVAPSTGLDAEDHARWVSAWRDAQPWLEIAGGGRAREVDALLTCLVPLGGMATAHRSASRDEAFGAVLSSMPPSGLALAATLVHEVQHAKLLALSGLTALHTADAGARYWAPWRPDPRPFGGLLQGTFAHLALADFHLRVAPRVTSPARREEVWAEYARCRQQVAAALPQLLGARALTRHGRVLVEAMAAHHARISTYVPAAGHLERAAAYVETARALRRRPPPS